ncbi:MAG: DUF4349 domain-containing protein, partial [Chloroflexi bacterium]|nr:DUF4349 domain-containing protein [Chloroflexota bacterium]
MVKLVVLFVIAISGVLVACGGADLAETDDSSRGESLSSDEQVFDAGGFENNSKLTLSSDGAIGAAALPSSMPDGPSSREAHVTIGSLETAQRKIISVASVSLEVEAVQEAVVSVRNIAESLGGFVDQLSSSGGGESQQATITIRVPQVQFLNAIESIEALGQVVSSSVSSEDVSEQFIDLEARLKSSLRQEQSLLSLLERAETLNDLLTLERELSRVRSDIERIQGQLSFLERRVELATITVSLTTPKEEQVGEPPSGTLTVELSDATLGAEEVKTMVSTLGGEMDRVFLVVRDGEERAELSFRVFSSDFEQAVSLIEDLGKVRSKELREGVSQDNGQQRDGEEPTAKLSVSLLGKPESSNTTLIIATAVPTGGVLLTVLLGAILYLTYAAGRRRGATA